MNKSNLFLVLLPLFLAFVSGCKKDDKEIGKVEITSPADGSEVSGLIEVRVSVENGEMVDYVQLYIDGETSEQFKDISEPYIINWNAGNYAPGSTHTLLAKAYGSDALSSASEFVGVTVVSSLEIPTDGLMLYLPFTGNAQDGSGNAHPTTVVGAIPSADRHGNAGQAYLFNGSSYVSINDPALFNGMSSFTLAAWVKPTNLNVKQYIVAKADPYRDFSMRITDGNHLGMLIQPSDLSVPQVNAASHTFGTTEWVHCTAVWTGSAMKVYVNGSLLSENNFSGLVIPWTGTTLRVGSIADQEFFYGLIDEVLIYNRVLSDSEIAGLAAL